VRRGFFRGEFGVWFEAHESMQTHRDSIIRDTLVLGPAAVSLYLDRAKQSELQATLFDKVFVNLQHDWQADRFGLLYLGWRPYKFGPVPIVPETTDWGSPKRFETFLTERGYLLARRLGARKEAGELYRPPSVEALNWPELYDRNVSGAVRTHTASLVRLYAGIQAKCTTTRTPKKKTSSHPAMRSDPLIVLASARNSRIAYVSGWFEVMHWKKKGEELFPTLKLLVEGNSRDLRQVVMHDIVQFGEPVGLLDDKIDMYRNIGHLRKQLEDLRKEYDACETLLETVDSSPKFESVGDFPMYNLEWAHSVLHAFTHMMRQVLTSCGLDNEKPKLHKSVEDGDEYEDARHYLQQLTALLPDSAVLHDNLEVCIVAAQAGKLTKDMLDALQRAFAAIVRKLSDERTLPNPTATQERAMDGLKKIDSRMRVLSDIESIAPYAIVVISMGNLVSFANASQIAEAANDELAYRLRTLVASHAPGITSKHAGVKLVYLNNRNMILVGRSADEALRCTVEFMSDAMRTFNNINQEHLVPFNLLRAGIAWHEGEKGEEYDGIRPGLLAFRLADDLKQAVGSISISQAVHAKLSPELAQEFDALENAENDLHAQGPLYNRNWREGNDAGVVGGDFVPQKSDGKVPKRLDAPAARQSIDFLLVVALREELEALLGKLGGYRQLPPFENDIHTYFAADVQTTFADGSAGMYEVAVMSLVGMGRPQATKGTTDAIHTFDPRYVLLVGIAGGISAKGVRIGDVLVADQIVDYELQKLSSGKVDTRYELYRADARLLSACQSLIGNRWLELVGTTRPEAGIPKCHIGHIASGDKKIVVGQALEVYQDVWTKLVGVEMEGSGAALAAFQSAKPPGFFMVRGVSDLVDENGDTSEIEKWRPYACDVAASYAVGLLRSGPVVARVGRSGT
jgi:nucleoside phosphorylase